MNLTKILAIISNDLRVFFADRGNLVGLIVIPIGLTMLLGSVFAGNSGGVQRLNVDVIDNDQSGASASFLENLVATNPTLALCPRDAGTEGVTCNLEDATLTQDLALTRLDEGDTNAVLVIPAGFGANLEAAEMTSIDYYALGDASGGFSDPVAAAVQTTIQGMNSAITASRVGVNALETFTTLNRTIPLVKDEADRAALLVELREEAGELIAGRPLTIRYVLASTGEEVISGVTQGFGQSVPGQGATFVLFTVLGATAFLLQERQQWTLQRLVMMPLSRAEVVAGKIGTFFTLGMIQYLIVFAVGLAVGVDFGDSPLAIIVLIVSFVMAITALSLALATRVRTEGQVTGVTMIISFTLAPLGGAWWPLEIVPDFMRLIGHLSPVAWVMDGFTAIIFQHGGLGDILIPVLVLWGFAAVFFALGIMGFKYE